MKRSTKVTLSVVGLTIIVLVVGVAGFAGYTYYRFQTRNEAGRSSGVEFGRSTDNRGCVDEAVRQFAEYKETSFSIRFDQFQIVNFTKGCLTTSRPTPKFCRGVPSPGTFLDRLNYSPEQCRKAGLSDSGPCLENFKEVIAYCTTHPDVN